MSENYIFYMFPFNGCYVVCLSSITVAMAAALEATPIGEEFYLANKLKKVVYMAKILIMKIYFLFGSVSS